MDVKKNIKKFRELNNYSQEYVARMLGITQQAYQQIETGDTKIEAELLARLAVILHVRVEQLFSGEGEPNKPLEATGNDGKLLEKLIDKLIESKDQVIETKDDVIASKDKVIELLTNGKGKKKRA